MSWLDLWRRSGLQLGFSIPFSWTGYKKVDRPKSIENWSPNFTPCDPGREIKCVIIHATATESKESPLAWLCNPESKVSAHYLIDTLGAIYHLVHEQNVAWHAGVSEWDSQANVNQFSIGIELVNPNDGKTEYPAAELESCADLVSDICQDNGITTKNVVGHCDISPVRKTDPAGFPWVVFRAGLIQRGVKEA